MPRAPKHRRANAPTPDQPKSVLRSLDRTGSVAFADRRIGVSRNLDGTDRAVFYRGWQVGSVGDYVRGLLQFLLRANRPEIYARKAAIAPPGPPLALMRALSRLK
jgi:hypothetical protein